MPITPITAPTAFQLTPPEDLELEELVEGFELVLESEFGLGLEEVVEDVG
jgi:hypothetical protein